MQLALKHLRRYVAREGHARVHWLHVEAGFRLGQWVAGCRCRYKRGRLWPDLVRELEALPGWVWVGQHATERTGYWAALRAFVAKHGHSRVGLGHVEGGLWLGKWVSQQRHDWSRKRLSAAEAQALEALPGWEWAPLAAEFERCLDALRAFHQREGHADPHSSDVEAGVRIGRWVASKRSAYRRGVLPQRWIDALEAIPGWSWQARRDAALERAFERGWNRMQQFVARHGHAAVAPDACVDDFELGRWARGMRARHRNGRLTDQLARRLESLPGWEWSPRPFDSDRFEEGLRLLRGFVEREGHARVHWLHVEGGFPLGWWVVSRRRRYRSGTLPAPCVRALEAVPGWTWTGRLPPRPPQRGAAQSKRCPRCGRRKPASGFYANPKSKDGLSSYCRACHGDYGRARRARGATRRGAAVPMRGRFGEVPPSDESLMQAFLGGSPFLFTGPDYWNALGLGATALFALPRVYNTKHSGVFEVGGRRFDLRRVAFPKNPPPEWFVIDLLQHADEAGASRSGIIAALGRALSRGTFNQMLLLEMARRYGSRATQAAVEAAATTSRGTGLTEGGPTGRPTRL